MMGCNLQHGGFQTCGFQNGKLKCGIGELQNGRFKNCGLENSEFKYFLFRNGRF